MMTKIYPDNPKPFYIVTPGQILLRELEARDLTQADLADIMGRPAKTINAIIKNTKEITPETAQELEAALDIPASNWLNLNAKYRLHLAEKIKQPQKRQRIYDRSLMYHLAPIREMQKLGWISFGEDTEKNKQELQRFLQVDALSEEKLEKTYALIAANFRHSDKLIPSAPALYAWLCKVKQMAEKQQEQQKLKKYSEEKIIELIEELKAYFESVESIKHVPDLLAKYGICLVYVPHLQKTYLDGALLMHKGKPVIAMTLRHDRIDNYWFTLLHELGHLFHKHQHGEEDLFLDNLDDPDHNQQQQEMQANQFARENLIQPEQLSLFLSNPRCTSKSQILAFASRLKRHPGIVLGQMQFEKKVSYGHHRDLLEKIKALV